MAPYKTIAYGRSAIKRFTELVINWQKPVSIAFSISFAIISNTLASFFFLIEFGEHRLKSLLPEILGGVFVFRL
jgi:hypothetical protein